MQYVGLDVHKEFCQASILNEEGEEISNERILSDVDSLNRFLDTLDEAKVVLESTNVWEYIYETIESAGFDVVLAHPKQVKAIAAAKVKTDKVDARTLAELLRADMIPASYVPERDVRDLREALRTRASLVCDTTRLKNMIHAKTLRRGLRKPQECVRNFSLKHRLWLRSMKIHSLDHLLNSLDGIDKEINEINKDLLEQFKRNPQAQLISEIPGIGYYGALMLTAEIGDVHRFHDPEHLSSYAGLVPTVHQSANSCYYGHISKQGSRYLRWILVEAVHIHVKNSPDSQISKFFEKKSKRIGKNKATIAAARKLLHIVYWMLIKEEHYHSHGLNLREPTAT
jgi:transposase